MSYERMKAMITIVERGDGIALSKLFTKNGVQLHLQIAADGTASSELLAVLGLSHSERDMIISFAPESRIDALMNMLYDDYRGLLRVRGISRSLAVLGYGSNCDAYHLTAPDPSGDGLRRAVNRIGRYSHTRTSAVNFENNA